ncbi:hypothetical protein [Fundidesulfovibrio putealis]|uniref:hypothetical protein n=1 Tax=Fundidesulfovibrio putealis TaxID=270496 RepID=UPI00040C1724|nr:hypothetical protein [Fundidesulfovibrio putealis]KAF0234884.1 MAG: hypothetical protein FD177_447 [Desulfovibrionaceae bacterium]
MPTNEERRERAMQALEFYKAQCLGEGGQVGQDDLTDLLSDLRHLAAHEAEDFDFADAVRLSETHFEEEQDENPDTED